MIHVILPGLHEVLSNSGHFSWAWGMILFPSCLLPFRFFWNWVSDEDLWDHFWSLNLERRGGSSNEQMGSWAVMLLQGSSLHHRQPSSHDGLAQLSRVNRLKLPLKPHGRIAHWMQAAVKIWWNLGPGD